MYKPLTVYRPLFHYCLLKPQYYRARNVSVSSNNSKRKKRSVPNNKLTGPRRSDELVRTAVIFQRVLSYFLVFPSGTSYPARLFALSVTVRFPFFRAFRVASLCTLRSQSPVPDDDDDDECENVSQKHTTRWSRFHRNVDRIRCGRAR